MSKRLYVGGLHYETDDTELKKLFEEGDGDEGGNLEGCGIDTVESSKVILDRDTRKSRGFGFVEMNTPEDAAKAIELFHGKFYQLRGKRRELTVDKAADRSPSSSNPRARSDTRGKSRFSGGYNQNKKYSDNY